MAIKTQKTVVVVNFAVFCFLFCFFSSNVETSAGTRKNTETEVWKLRQWEGKESVCLFCSAKLIKFQLWLTTASLVDWICTPLKHRKVSALFFNNTIFFFSPVHICSGASCDDSKVRPTSQKQKADDVLFAPETRSRSKKATDLLQTSRSKLKKKCVCLGVSHIKRKIHHIVQKEKKICQLNSRVPFHTSNFAIYVFFLRTH